MLANRRPDETIERAIIARLRSSLAKAIHFSQLKTANYKEKLDTILGLIVHNFSKRKYWIYFGMSMLPFPTWLACVRNFGFVVLLTDDTEPINWMQYHSFECKRVVWSINEKETHGFVDSFDTLHVLTHKGCFNKLSHLTSLLTLINFSRL